MSALKLELQETFPEEGLIGHEEKTNSKLIPTEDNTSEKHPNISRSIFKNKAIATTEDDLGLTNSFPRSASAGKVAILKNPDVERARKISTGSSASLSHVTRKISDQQPSNPSCSKKLTVAKTSRRSPAASGFQYISTPFHGSTLCAFEDPSEFASQISMKSVKENLKSFADWCCCRPSQGDDKKDPSKYLDLSLLKDPIYLVVLISNATSAISFTNFNILVPAFAHEMRFSKAVGAYLLSILSSVDLVGRLGGSALSDSAMSAASLFIIGLVLSGLGLVAVPYVTSFTAITALSCVYGLGSGINIGVTALTMIEMCGVEKLTSSYGISLFVNGMLQLTTPLICGIWYDYYKSYKGLFVSLGFVVFAGAALWVFVPIIYWIRKREEKKRINMFRKLELQETLPEESLNSHEEQSIPNLILTGDNTSEIHLHGSPRIFKNRCIAITEDEYGLPNSFARSVSAGQVENLKTQDVERTRKIFTGCRAGLPQISCKISNHQLNNPSIALESVPEGESCLANSTDAYSKRLKVLRMPRRSSSVSSFQYISTHFHGSTLCAFEKPSEFASQFSLKSVKECLRSLAYWCCCSPWHGEQKKKQNKYFDLNLLKDPIYLVILISNCTCAISCTNFIILVPSYAQEMGFSKSLGAYLLSIISTLDLIGRIGGSAFTDLVATPKQYFFVSGLLLTGLSLLAIPMMSSYLAISAFCCLYGIANGVMVGVTALVMTEMLGTERLMSSYGISLFVNGMLQLIGPPICGLWFEYFGSYKGLFVILGLILVGGASLWGFIPIIHRREIEEEQRNKMFTKDKALIT